MRVITAAICLCLCSCGDSGASPPSEANFSAVAPSAEGGKQPNIEAARKAIAREKQVLDFILEPQNAVTLQVAVRDDGTRRYGYAQYLCLLLSDHGFDMEDTAVRVVDAAKLAASNGDFRSISLGTVQCRDGSKLD